MAFNIEAMIKFVKHRSLLSFIPRGYAMKGASHCMKSLMATIRTEVDLLLIGRL